jgi:hypothetical protein
MKGFVYQLVQRLSEPESGLSRNRHHALFASPEGNRALHLQRHLQSLTQDVERFGAEAQLLIERTATDWEIRLEVPRLKFRRLARLTADDLSVLRNEATTFPAALRDALTSAGAWL